MTKSSKFDHGSVELFLMSECVSLPDKSSGFTKELYRSTGVVWPYAEFEGPYQMYRHARLLKTLERRFGPGDAMVLKMPVINRITTFVALDRRSPVLWNREHHRIFEAPEGAGEVLLQLPHSFQFPKKKHEQPK